MTKTEFLEKLKWAAELFAEKKAQQETANKE